MYDRFATTRLIDLWLTEDIGACDLTVQVMIEPGETGRFRMNARETMVLSGLAVAAEVFRRYEPALEIAVAAADGDKVEKGATLLTVAGPAQGILTAERTALNIVQRLSGIATETARYVEIIKGTKARLIDTRKTTPGLRMLEKHAVACGGGLNHRLGLDNGVMIKDNHIAAVGDLDALREKVLELAAKPYPIVIEAATLDQALLFATFPVRVLMLDNFTVPQLRRAVPKVRALNPRLEIEASGGVTLETVGAIARTGVDRVSVGALTHSAPAVDISLEL